MPKRGRSEKILVPRGIWRFANTPRPLAPALRISYIDYAADTLMGVNVALLSVGEILGVLLSVQGGVLDPEDR
jgi:hypothetical protein